MNINKTKVVAFRLQELDFELLRKQAKKANIRTSDLLRIVLKGWLKQKIKSL